MTRKLVRQMLIAQILSALTVSLCLLIDNVMINRFLGVNAIAAYELSNPVLLIIGAIGSMLSAGVQVACSRSLGNGSSEETNRNYSTAAALTLIISLAFTAAVLLFRVPIARLCGAGEPAELFDHTTGYLAGFVVGSPASMGALILIPFLQIAGKSGLLILAVLGMTVSDIALDLLNALVFKGGMFGMGLASSLSYYVAMAIGMVYFLSPKCVFRFSLRYVRLSKVIELFRGGIPMAFNMASSVILVFVLNRLLLDAGGAHAVAAYAVVSGIGNASNCISTGMSGVSLTLSGVLYSEEDRTGLKTLLSLLVRYAWILGLAVAAVLIIFAPVLIGVFLPRPGDTRDMAILGIRLFAAGLIPCCVNNALRSFYQGTDRVGLTEMISLAEGAILPSLAALLLAKTAGTNGIWLYFIIGETLTLGLLLLYVRKKAGGRVSMDSVMLLSDSFGASPDEMLEMDIHSLAEVTDAAVRTGAFCAAHGMDGKFCNHVALCVEEMAGNTVTHGFDPDGHNHLSILMQHKNRRWILRFRDDCTGFDPVRYVPPEGHPDALGIRLMLAMADEVHYTYSLSLNNLTLILNENKTEPEPAESEKTKNNMQGA